MYPKDDINSEVQPPSTGAAAEWEVTKKIKPNKEM